MGWVKAVKAWGAEVEAVVVHLPDNFKDFRQRISITPTTTPQGTSSFAPGPWDVCMLANIATPQDSLLVSSLFKRWHPAIAILSTHSSLSRIDTIAMLPLGLPTFYHKNMITLRHVTIGGVSSGLWRFTHYMRWVGIVSYPSLMTSDNLPCILQTALSDTNGGARGVSFEPRLGLDVPSLAIGVLSSSLSDRPTLVYSGDAVGPDLSCLSYRGQHFLGLCSFCLF
jgi:hypothetical protein